MRFRLRTLMIVLALGPPVLAAMWPLIEPLMFPPRRARINEVFQTRSAVVRLVPSGIYPIMPAGEEAVLMQPSTDNRP